MPLRHDNSTQTVKPVTFSPLLRNESPYYNNLNRGPKNAFDYADSINKILSYGGFVSRVKASNQSTSFSLYNIVKILDGEVIVDSRDPASGERFAIVVTEADTDGYYIVCTFCPNFVYPPEIATFDFPSKLGVSLAISKESTPPTNYLTEDGETGDVIVAKITGENSIFFCGTTRLFGVFSAA